MTNQPVLIPVECPKCTSPVDIAGKNDGDIVECESCGHNFIFHNQFEKKAETVEKEPTLGEAVTGCLVEIIGRWTVGILMLGTMAAELLKWYALPQTSFFWFGITICSFFAILISTIVYIKIGLPLDKDANTFLSMSLFYVTEQMIQLLTGALGISFWFAIGLSVPGFFLMEGLIFLILFLIK